MALLRILSGDRSGETVDLSGAVVVLGRHPGCDIRISDETVSRRHARIISQKGGYFVEDLGSRNGTLLNGRPVTSLSRLCHLDQISIFDTTVEYREGARNGLHYGTGAATITVDEHRTSPSRQPGLYQTTAEIDLTAVGIPQPDSRSDVKLQAVLEITRYLRSSLEPDEVLSRI